MSDDTNDVTGAAFGPESGVVESIDADEAAERFYVQEVITEKVVDTHTELGEDDNGDPITLTVAEEHDEVNTRKFGPFVKSVADDYSRYVTRRFKSLALAGDQEVTLVPEHDHDEQAEADQQPEAAAGATDPTTSDALDPNADKSPEVGGEVPVDQPDIIGSAEDADAPSWSVDENTLPEGYAENGEDGNVSNPPADAPASNPNPDAEPVQVPSAPEEDPSTGDAVTNAATTEDGETIDPTSPPVSPEAPNVEQGPADGEPISGTVADTEPTVADTETIPVADTAGDSGADQIDAENPVTGEATDPAADPEATEPTPEPTTPEQSESEQVDAGQTEASQEASGGIISSDPVPDNTEGAASPSEASGEASGSDDTGAASEDVTKAPEASEGQSGSDVPSQDEPVSTVEANPEPTQPDQAEPAQG